MPTLIAYYKAATGWMGLISKTVVCLEVKPTPGVRPLIKKLGFFLSEACQLLKYNEYTTMCMGKVARYKEIVQAKILHHKVVPCHCRSLQRRSRQDCPCLLYHIVGIF